MSFELPRDFSSFCLALRDTNDDDTLVTPGRITNALLASGAVTSEERLRMEQGVASLLRQLSVVPILLRQSRHEGICPTCKQSFLFSSESYHELRIAHSQQLLCQNCGQTTPLQNWRWYPVYSPTLIQVQEEDLQQKDAFQQQAVTANHAYPSTSKSDTSREMIQHILQVAWLEAPTSDEIEGYWFLRGILHAWCQENNRSDSEVLDELGPFLSHLVSDEEEEER